MTGPKRLLITRCVEDFEATRDLARTFVLEAIPFPLIRRVPLSVPSPAPGDWAVFTSPAAVKLWPYEYFPGTKLACVGEGTARAARARGWEVAFIPTEATGDCLGRDLPGHPKERVVFVVGEQGGATLTALLAERGMVVERLNLYRTEMSAPPASPRLQGGHDFDGVLFMSPSAAKGWARQSVAALGSARVLVIGPTTAAACADLGIPVHLSVPAGNLELLLKNFSETPS